MRRRSELLRQLFRMEGEMFSRCEQRSWVIRYVVSNPIHTLCCLSVIYTLDKYYPIEEEMVLKNSGLTLIFKEKKVVAC